MVRRFVLASAFFLLLIRLGAQPVSCDSTKNGSCIVYNDSGRKVLKVSYRDTLRHGIWVEYDAHGFVSRKTKYRKGQVIWIYIYRNARIAETIDRHGKVRKMKNCGC